MRNPRQYPQSLLIAQGVVVAVYIVIGVVLYYYCGSYVASPALGSAGGTVKRISYGLALPGLIVTATIVAHVKKNRQSQHLEKLANLLYHCYIYRFRRSLSSCTSSKAPGI